MLTTAIITVIVNHFITKILRHHCFYPRNCHRYRLLLFVDFVSNKDYTLQRVGLFKRLGHVSRPTNILSDLSRSYLGFEL